MLALFGSIGLATTGDITASFLPHLRLDKFIFPKKKSTCQRFSLDEAMMAQIKYLSQVPSGLACGCTCLVCQGPLVARKGVINEWHFAHAGGQTHVDCIVGARNFLRRVAIEVLCQAPSVFRVKPNQRMVSFAHLSQTIALNDDIHDLVVKAFPLDAKVGMASIVGTGTTVQECIPFDLHVQVEGEEVSVLSNPEKGLLLLRVPFPAAAGLHSDEETRQALASTMTLEWQHLPNAHALAIRTLQSLPARYQDEEAARAQLMRAQKAQLTRAMPVRNAPTTASAFPSTALIPTAATVPAWVSHYEDKASLFGHRFRDGSYWLLGKTQYGFLLHPWPLAEDGWDEALPPSLGVSFEDLGGYICGFAFYEANQRVNAFSTGVQNTREPAELNGIFQSLGWQ